MIKMVNFGGKKRNMRLAQTLFIAGVFFFMVLVSPVTADWGKAKVDIDSNGFLKVILENSKILVRYIHYDENGHHQHVIKALVIKSVNEDQAGTYLDACSDRGLLTNAVIVEDGEKVKRVRLEWDNGDKVSEVSIYPDSNYIKIDYLKYGVNVVDQGSPGGDFRGKHEIYGASEWKRTTVMYPELYFDRYLEDVGFQNITQRDDPGPLDYNGWLIMGVYSEANGRGFGRVMPTAQTDVVKLLFERGLEFFSAYKRKKEPYTGYLFVVTGGGADEILSMGKRLADGLEDSEGNWRLDEGNGADAADSSGNGNDGIIKGATWTNGVNGGGLNFNGIDNFLSLPVMNNNEISLSAWFNKSENDTTNADAVFGAYKGNPDVRLREGFDLRFPKQNPDKLQFILVTEDQAGNRTQKIAQQDLGNSVAKWLHAACTYNKTTGKQKLYVDGQLVDTKKHPAGNTMVFLTAWPDTRIGHSRAGNGYFNGNIDNVRLYNQALNDQSVQYLYANSLGLEGYWKFEEGKGTFTADCSGNGNYGAINGAEWETIMNGSGLNFNGISDYVSVPVMNYDELSIAARFYKEVNDITNADAIMGGYKSNSDLQLREGFDLRFPKWDPGKLQFILVTEDQAGNRTEKTAQEDLGNSEAKWFHAVCTYNRTTGKQKLYVDGQLVDTKTHPAGNTIVPLTSWPDMRIGHSRVSNGYFQGKIDEVRLYKRELICEEVLYLYNAL